MLHQTYKNPLFGCPILKLPKTYITIYWVKSNDIKYNSVEYNAYNIIKNRFINIINSFTWLKKLG